MSLLKKAVRSPSKGLPRVGWVGLVQLVTAAACAFLLVQLQVSGTVALLMLAPITAGILATMHWRARAAQIDADIQTLREQAEVLAQAHAARSADQTANLLRSEQRFHSAFNHASIGMALIGAGQVVRQANAALATLLAQPTTALAGLCLLDLVVPEDAEPLLVGLGELRAGHVDSISLDVRLRRESGEVVHVALHGSVFADAAAGETSLILQLQDITLRRHAEERLQHLAFHDALTDLANRRRFEAELARSLEAYRADPLRRCAILFLDFDRFKLINDSLGHDVGDQFLREVAKRLRLNVRPSDLVARLGGDEFAILLRLIDDERQPMQLAERLQVAVSQPLITNGLELHTSASIGIRICDEGTTTPLDMLRDADTAMYRAKATGKARYCVFDAGMHAQVCEQLQLENDLRGAFDRDELVVQLQPLVALHSQVLIGFEALVRWQHPLLGTLAPDRFVALAEESGQISALTQRVLDRACAAVQSLVAATGVPTPVRVNINALDLCQRGFAKRISDLLARHHMLPWQLTLEITEDALMDRLEGATQTLGELRDLGVGLSIDDFGTGRSSLSHLSLLPIHSLKIDRRFVQHLAHDKASAEIVRAVVQLGLSLGKVVVAEGVESRAQLGFLRELGCEQGQGFLFGEPRAPLVWQELMLANARPFALPVPLLPANPANAVNAVISADAANAAPPQ